jgi:prepilin-type N-terminal cleavage/methylation domain-containing protein
MNDTARRDKRMVGSGNRKIGFTLIELLVVITIISLLIGIVLPSLSQAREQSKKAVCLANLRSIGQGIHEYLNEHGDRYFFAASFPSVEHEVAQTEGRKEYPPLPEALKNQLKGGAEAFRCPSDRNTMDLTLGKRTYFETEETSYEWLSEYNGKKINRDALTLMLGPLDAPMIWDFEPYHGGPDKPGSHHVLFADLSAREDNWSEERYYFHEP